MTHLQKDLQNKWLCWLGNGVFTVFRWKWLRSGLWKTCACACVMYVNICFLPYSRTLCKFSYFDYTKAIRDGWHRSEKHISLFKLFNPSGMKFDLDGYRSAFTSIHLFRWLLSFDYLTELFAKDSWAYIKCHPNAINVHINTHTQRYLHKFISK